MEEELKNEIKALKEENLQIKRRLEELEEIVSIIKEDLYIEYEVEDEFGEDRHEGCTGDCSACKMSEEKE